MTERRSYTGVERRRKTSRLVRVTDFVARLLITVGGIGTIVAVLLVCVFLVSVAVPLFSSPTYQAESPLPAAPEPPLRVGLDSYQMLGWELSRNGMLRIYRADTGETIDQRPLVDDAVPTAFSFSPEGDGGVALGFDDGTVRLGRIGFSARFLDDSQAPAEAKKLSPHDLLRHGNGLLTRIDDDRFRLVEPEIAFEAPIKPVDPSRIVLIDHMIHSGSPRYCVYTGDGKLRVYSAVQRRNLMTGKSTYVPSGSELPAPPVQSSKSPLFLRLAGRGDAVFVAWEDGRVVQYDTRDYKQTAIVAQFDLVEEPSARLTALEFVLGRGTLIAGDSHGKLSAWFRAPAPEGTSPDTGETVPRLVDVRQLRAGGDAITTIANSARNRIIAAGTTRGEVELYYVTTGKQLGRLQVAGHEPIAALTVAPKADGLLATTSHGSQRWLANFKYPEASFAALFLPVWYEGYSRPRNLWQSTSGTDDFEPKLGLMPLIFGTLKATFYSMFFGAPLALLAAIYANAYLGATARARIKPIIELMASLPSVVLGFVAAMVIAPWVESRVPTVVCAFVSVPAVLLFGARLWQLLPRSVAVQHVRWRLPLILGIAIPCGVAIAAMLGDVVESWLFAGSIKLWLDGQVGTGAGAWMFVLVPICACASFYVGRDINDLIQRRTTAWTPRQVALLDLAKFTVGMVATVFGAWLLGQLLNAGGLDPRGTFVSTYDQRNAMVVGFVMGFAIIPIIFTIADDALSAVPETLRSASLGAGATQWQTMTRVVVPTAMSGLFSAVMIGLGRAVGETMIVLMAAGNTPDISLNLFQGFRTLSANLAVELPEAVEGSAHYRTLYLQALILFAMTFVLNSVAESIRIRFRKRAYEL